MYDRPLTMSYNWASLDFGAAFALEIQGPAGSTGVIRGIHVTNVTEAFAGLQPVELGVATDADLYASYTPSALTVGGSETDDGSEGSSGVWKKRTIEFNSDDPPTLDNLILISNTAFTTGIANLLIVVDWDADEPRHNPLQTAQP